MGPGDLLTLKKCTGCLAQKARGEFYSKGARLDSKCKLCILEIKRKDYEKKALGLQAAKSSPKIDARVSTDIKRLDFLLDLIAGLLVESDLAGPTTTREPLNDSGSQSSKISNHSI